METALEAQAILKDKVPLVENPDSEEDSGSYGPA